MVVERIKRFTAQVGGKGRGRKEFSAAAANPLSSILIYLWPKGKGGEEGGKKEVLFVLATLIRAGLNVQGKKKRRETRVTPRLCLLLLFRGERLSRGGRERIHPLRCLSKDSSSIRIGKKKGKKKCC